MTIEDDDSETYENGPVPPDDEQGDPGTPEDPEDEDPPEADDDND